MLSMTHALKLQAVMLVRMRMTGQDLNAQAAASSNLLLPQKVSQCGSTPSQRYCILVTAGHPTSSSVAKDRVPFTRRRACDPDGTAAYAGSVSSIGRADTHVIDLYLPFCNFSFKFH